MSDPVEVLNNALSLDVHERAALAQKLLASLEDLTEEETDRLWTEEANRRLEAYREGRATAAAADDVAAKAAKLFR